MEIQLSMSEGMQEVFVFVFVCFFQRGIKRNYKSFLTDDSMQVEYQLKVYPQNSWGPQVTVPKENFDS